MGAQGCSKRTDKQLDGRLPTKRSSRPSQLPHRKAIHLQPPGVSPRTLSVYSPSSKVTVTPTSSLLHLLLHFMCVLRGAGCMSEHMESLLSIHLVGLRDLAQALRHGDKCLLLLPFTLPLRAEIGRICFEFYIHRITNVSFLVFPSPSLKTHILGVGCSSTLFSPWHGARARVGGRTVLSSLSQPPAEWRGFFPGLEGLA